MGIRKNWQVLEPSSLERVKGQLGVFELGNDAGEIIYIGAADARSRFGLKGVLEANLDKASNFRCEVTTMYSSRKQELLMIYHAEHGQYPPLNQDHETRGLGRLSP